MAKKTELASCSLERRNKYKVTIFYDYDFETITKRESHCIKLFLVKKKKCLTIFEKLIRQIRLYLLFCQKFDRN
jgi:hypothetical protein